MRKSNQPGCPCICCCDKFKAGMLYNSGTNKYDVDIEVQLSGFTGGSGGCCSGLNGTYLIAGPHTPFTGSCCFNTTLTLSPVCSSSPNARRISIQIGNCGGIPGPYVGVSVGEDFLVSADYVLNSTAGCRAIGQILSGSLVTLPVTTLSNNCGALGATVKIKIA